MGDRRDFSEDQGSHVGDLDLPSSDSVSDPPDDGSPVGGMSPSSLDPLAVVGGDDVGDQVVEILEELRKRARGLRDYADQLLDQVEGMRELVLSLSSEGLARRELEERLAVLEAERDVLARQLGKVRRENEEELSLARERIKGLETELSLSAGRSTPIPGEESDATPESRDASANLGEPVVETVGAAQRRESLRSRPQRSKSTARPPPFPRAAEPPPSTRGEEREADLWAPEEQKASGGAASPATAPQTTEEAFAGLLDDELELAVDNMQVEDEEGGDTDVGVMPPVPDGEIELETNPDAVEAEPADLASGGSEATPGPGRDSKGPEDIKTSSASVTLALEDLLSSYLDDE